MPRPGLSCRYLPRSAEQWAGFVVSLGLITIFYGALLALMQINIRRLLAFSVISHVGMIVIGLFCFNEHGLNGSYFPVAGLGLGLCRDAVQHWTGLRTYPYRVHPPLRVVFLIPISA